MSQASRRAWLAAVPGATLLPAAAQAAPPPATGTGIYNVRDYGAKGDGATLDTAAVQAAIDACHRDQGGTVLVPAGSFLIGAVELKSNVTLHIAAEGRLLGTTDGKQYHAIDAIPLEGDHTLGDGNWALLYAVNARNVTVEGPGTIDGQGAAFRSPGRGVPSPAGLSSHQRPYHLLCYRCENLTVRNLFLTAGAYHSVRIALCSFVHLDGIRIFNRVNHNNDGFHFISARYLHISNCDVQCQDDACALFGSCRFVTVTNSSFSTRWSVFRFGGGQADNIVVSNCLIYDTYGCPIKLRCGPGDRFENMSFANLVMRNVTGPISIGLGPMRERASGAPAETPGVVRNISFRNIDAAVCVPQQLPDMPFLSGYNPGEIKSCMVLNGVDAYIENISFDDVHVTFPGGGTPADAAPRAIPALAGEYYALGVLPAYALYARRVRGLSMSNVHFEAASPEARPAMVFDGVEDAAITALAAQGDAAAASLLRFTNTRDVLLTACRVLRATPAFLDVEGSASRNIRVSGGDLSKAREAVVFGPGAPRDAVR